MVTTAETAPHARHYPTPAGALDTALGHRDPGLVTEVTNLLEARHVRRLVEVMAADRAELLAGFVASMPCRCPVSYRTHRIASMGCPRHMAEGYLPRAARPGRGESA